VGIMTGRLAGLSPLRMRPALVVSGGLNNRRDQIIALAARHAIPAVYANHEYVQAGGLMSYSAYFYEDFRQAGVARTPAASARGFQGGRHRTSDRHGICEHRAATDRCAKCCPEPTRLPFS